MRRIYKIKIGSMEEMENQIIDKLGRNMMGIKQNSLMF